MIYLVRHGSTVDNERKLYCVDESPHGLTEKGAKEAQWAGSLLKDKNIKMILSSDYDRAIETADIIGSACGVSMSIEIALRERNYGRFARTHRDVLISERIVLGHRFSDPSQDWFGVPEVEQDDIVYERLRPVMKKVVAELGSTVLVTHAGVIKSFLHVHFQMNPEQGAIFKVLNGAVVCLSGKTVDDLKVFGLLYPEA